MTPGYVSDMHLAEACSDGAVRKSPPVALFMESDVGLFVHIAALLALNVPVRPEIRSSKDLLIAYFQSQFVSLSIRLSSAAVRHSLDQIGTIIVAVSSRTSHSIEDALCENENATKA